MINFCPCSSGLTYVVCCEPYHQNKFIPATAEALMRSRYSAYALHNIDYLIATTHVSKRHLHQKDAIKEWATANIWLKLEICSAEGNMVEFKAYFQNNGQLQIHHERSTFKKQNGIWFYLNGLYLS